MAMEKLRQDTIGCVRSCLVSIKGAISLYELERDYAMLVGKPIPYRMLGHANLEQFVRSVPSLTLATAANGQLYVDAKCDERSKNIAMLVARQKNGKKKGSGKNHYMKYAKPPTSWRPMAPAATPPTTTASKSSLRVAQLSHQQFVTSPRKSAMQRLTPSSINNNNIEETRTKPPPKPVAVRFVASGDASKDLIEFARFHQLGEPNVLVKERKSKRQKAPNYDCMIKIAHLAVSSYPEDFFEERAAVAFASQAAYAQLVEKHGFERKPCLPISDAAVVGERVPQLIGKHCNGVWSTQLEEDYKDIYGEQLPPNWVRIVDASPNIAVRVFSNKTQLMFCPEHEKTKMLAALACDVSIPTSAAHFDGRGILMARVTCPISSDEVWCRQIGNEQCTQFEEMLERMESYYDAALSTRRISASGRNVRADNYYVAWIQQWYRVRVISLVPADDNGGGGAQCHCVDCGDDVVVPLEHIYALRREFASSPAQAFVCRLAGLEEFTSDSEHILALQERDVTLEMIADDASLTVVMYDAATGASVNAELLNSIVADVATPQLAADGAPMSVRVTHVAHDGTLYVQMLGEGVTRVTHALSTLRIAAATPAHVTNGKMYVVQTSDGDEVHRVRVTLDTTVAGIARLHYVDLGRERVVQLAHTQLYALDDLHPTAARYPPQAVHVQLAVDIPPGFDIRTKLHTMLMTNNANVLMRIVASDPTPPPRVMLFVRVPSMGWLSVNDSIIFEASVATPSIGGGGGKLAAPQLPQRKEFYDVHVAYAISPSAFYVQPLRQAAQLREMQRDMQIRYRVMLKRPLHALHEVHVGDVYAAKHAKRWHRVIVRKVMHTTAAIVVSCVDYGYDATLSLDELFHLDEQFLQLPYQAVKAKLAGIAPRNGGAWTENDCKMFQHLVQERQFVSVLMAIDKDGVLQLQLIDTMSSNADVLIGDVLVDKGVAMKTP